ncbi:MAG: ComEA family DNA-binding protein [Corynebacterium camporealensis]|uniref:ComEA family DNA-binding protein n=1 Tax=Corynebacterium camporealensis TaxID=161896 RepID=UPI002A91B27E|nr:ComEA family DNA-binding protein [Corynebacterium camporealensis]MDY5840215.1 ComEA family DNA-binding protein [Corynebacterium camporealensis]
MGKPHVSDRLRELSRPTGEEELLAVDYPRPRLRIPAWQAAIVAVVGVAGVVLWLGLSSQESMPEPAAVSESATEAPASVVVSVIGEVDNPGLVTLAPDARVADALAIAQPRSDAELTVLNHAQKLTDGQQIHVLPKGAAPAEPLDMEGGAPDSVGAGGGISLNTASVEELKELSGVGEVTAAAIVAYREENGGFSSIEEIQEVSGIGPAKYAQLKDQVQL